MTISFNRYFRQIRKGLVERNTIISRRFYSILTAKEGFPKVVDTVLCTPSHLISWLFNPFLSRFKNHILW